MSNQNSEPAASSRTEQAGSPADTQSSAGSLNARQIRILRDEHMPTDESALSDYQKKTVAAIEEILVHAEQKYETSFSYAGYETLGGGEKGAVIAYPTAGSRASDCFRIERRLENGEWAYTDNYMTVAARALYQTYLADGLKALNPDARFTVISLLDKTDFDTVPADPNGLKGRVTATTAVFVSPDSVSEEAFGRLVADFRAWVNAEPAKGVYHMILLRQDDTAAITAANYEDYLHDTRYSKREKIYVN
jgi:hypothetical protein